MSTPSGGPRGPYAKTAERRAAVIAAAREVFATRGYQSGSLQDIAQGAGISQSALLYHFPDKERLLIAVLRDRDQRGDDPRLDGEDILGATLRKAATNEGEPRIVELYTVLCGEAATRGHSARPYFLDRFIRVRSEYEQEFRRLQADGALRPGVDPARAAAGLVALWDGIQLQWLLGVPDTDVVAVLRDHIALLLDAAPGRTGNG